MRYHRTVSNAVALCGSERRKWSGREGEGPVPCTWKRLTD